MMKVCFEVERKGPKSAAAMVARRDIEMVETKDVHVVGTRVNWSDCS